MLTGEIRNKVDKIWTDLWAGGITNPLTVIEQLTYLMFIRTLDEKDIETESMEALTGESMSKIFPLNEEGQSMRWSNFKTKDARIIFDTIKDNVFPFIKTISNDKTSAFTRYMEDAIFLIPTPQVLEKIITGLDELYEHEIQDLDMQGDLYEYMLGKLATAGQNGQFRTPKHIRDLMVQLMKPTPDDTVCDPACGTAGFLVSTAEYVRDEFGASMTTEQWDQFATKLVSGFDTDRTMLRLSAMNLMLHSISNPDIDYVDSVSKQNNISNKYSLILANPPFTGTIDATSIHDNLKTVCDTKKTELLFVALFLRMLKTGGRCAAIVPDGVLFGTTKAHKSLRKEIVENHKLEAIISMPSGVFKPYAGVSTAIIIFTKTDVGGTDHVWFYDMKADGYSLDDKRSAIQDNDIPDIIARFHNLEAEQERKAAEQSFMVEKSAIVDNDYDLSINRYKEIVYEKIEYDAPEVILDRLSELDKQIASKMDELRGLLK
ncbi:N-6 DNA methylase [Paenibacillus septentrionalis]|uniref:site-specific DNA-methyltransferase (adenine-specific) n=1 Tax=Paenibacillus septentrionalis TaxID=429342 RepID=A0ABW1V409_9BACL